MSNPGAASTTTTATLGQGSPWAVGDGATDLVGFYGATPVVQANAITAVTTTAAVAVSGTTVYGFGTAAQADLIVAQVNKCITALHNIGITA